MDSALRRTVAPLHGPTPPTPPTQAASAESESEPPPLSLSQSASSESAGGESEEAEDELEGEVRWARGSSFLRARGWFQLNRLPCLNQECTTPRRVVLCS